MTTQKKWLSITDYSSITELSISTIRRRIKNRKVVFKKQSGKFYILCEGERFRTEPDHLSILSELQEENRKLKELISEQDMLIKLYEEKLVNKQESTLSNKEIWGDYTPELSQ